MTMTPEQIASAWALANAATEGPWRATSRDAPEQGVYGGYRLAKMTGGEIVRDAANAAFIAASRELVPQLLTENTRITAVGLADAMTFLDLIGRLEDALEAERAKVARLVDGLEAIAKTVVFSMGIGIDARPTHEANMARAALALIKGGA